DLHDLGMHRAGVLRTCRSRRFGRARLCRIFLRIGLEPRCAMLAAEKVPATRVLDLGRGIRRLDFHPAYGIDGGLQILLRLGLELRRAVLAAEVVGLAAMR